MTVTGWKWWVGFALQALSVACWILVLALSK